VIVGILIHTCLCDDAYLNEMAKGDVLPGVCNSRESHQEFFLVQGNRAYVPLGPMSYNKARRMAENQTTFFGRIRNWVTPPKTFSSGPFAEQTVRLTALYLPEPAPYTTKVRGTTPSNAT
jgi:hypothetical protein